MISSKLKCSLKNKSLILDQGAAFSLWQCKENTQSTVFCRSCIDTAVVYKATQFLFWVTYFQPYGCLALRLSPSLVHEQTTVLRSYIYLHTRVPGNLIVQYNSRFATSTSLHVLRPTLLFRQIFSPSFASTVFTRACSVLRLLIITCACFIRYNCRIPRLSTSILRLRKHSHTHSHSK